MAHHTLPARVEIEYEQLAGPLTPNHLSLLVHVTTPPHAKRRGCVQPRMLRLHGLHCCVKRIQLCVPQRLVIDQIPAPSRHL